MEMGQTKSIIIDTHKRSGFFDSIYEYREEDTEHIVPEEMLETMKLLEMHGKIKTKANI